MDYKEMNKFSAFAWSYMPDEFDAIIMSGKYDTIELLYMHEYEIYFNGPVVDYINNNGIKLNCCTCAAEPEWVRSVLVECGINSGLIEVKNWPEFWFLRANLYLLQENKYYPKIERYNFNFKYPFLTFNGKARKHRTDLIDLLYKNNFLSKGIATYHQIGYNEDLLKWQWHPGHRLTIDNTFVKNRSPYVFSEVFLQSFLHIPTETTVDTHLISEKTAIPMLCKLPFLTVGVPGYHRRLQEMGFQLYDEIFDYSFDSEPDDFVRIEKLLKNVKMVIKNTHRLNELYLQILPKINYNKNLTKKYITTYEMIPEQVKSFYEDIKTMSTLSDWELELIQLFEKFTDFKIYKPYRMYEGNNRSADNI